VNRLLPLALVAIFVCAAAPAAALAHWQPAPQTAAWQWQLQGRLDPDLAASVYDIDGFESTKAQVTALHARGKKVVCYLDVGSWENFRPDRAEFPRSVRGATYEGFPNERWLDISRYRLFRKPLEQRISMCARKGFDAVEPDNVAGYENKTGFPLTAAEQLRFNRWIAAQVHERGMAVALKNDPGQVPQLLGGFDFAIVEECFQYEECGSFEPFVRAGKAVFEAEYELEPAEFCAAAKQLGFSAIGKSYDLFAQPWRPCEPLGAGAS
jgi:hypothetical protein